jgi:hypothetical protein
MTLSRKILRTIAFLARLDIAAGLTMTAALLIWMALH